MIYNKYLSFNVLYLFIIFLFDYLLFKVESFAPLRLNAYSISMENKPYFVGRAGKEISNKVFYFDVLEQFKFNVSMD
jgi:hypothetical protein